MVKDFSYNNRAAWRGSPLPGSPHENKKVHKGGRCYGRFVNGSWNCHLTQGIKTNSNRLSNASEKSTKTAASDLQSVLEHKFISQIK